MSIHPKVINKITTNSLRLGKQYFKSSVVTTDLSYLRHLTVFPDSVSPTFREQYAAVCNQPVDKLEELAECEDEVGTVTQLVKPSKQGEQNSNADADQDQLEPASPEPDVPMPATPEERGLACLNSMRQTLAAVWWFVQPILFSLIGAEVNLSTLGGASTGEFCLVVH